MMENSVTMGFSGEEPMNDEELFDEGELNELLNEIREKLAEEAEEETSAGEDAREEKSPSIKRHVRPSDNLLFVLGFAEERNIIEESIRHHVQTSDYSDREKTALQAFLLLLIYKTFHDGEDVFFHQLTPGERITLIFRKSEMYAEKPFLLLKGEFDESEERDHLISFYQERPEGYYGLVSNFLGMHLLNAKDPKGRLTQKNNLRSDIEILDIAYDMCERGSQWPYSQVRNINIRTSPNLLEEWKAWVAENDIPTIIGKLDKNIMGQQDAKTTVAFWVYKHIKRLIGIEEGTASFEAVRNNIILAGPSGSGKSQLFKETEELLPGSIPLSIVDACCLTPAGYKGPELQSVLYLINSNLEEEGKCLDQGLFVFDEADKILDADYSDGQSVRDEMLSLLQNDTSYRFESEASKRTHISKIGATISYGFSGTFRGITEVKKTTTCGFIAKEKEEKKDYRLELAGLGISQEFIGRINDIAILSQPTRGDVRAYLDSEQFTSFMSGYEIFFDLDLSLTNGAKDILADVASKSNFGMRQIQNIVGALIKGIILKPKREREFRVSKTVVEDFLDDNEKTL